MCDALARPKRLVSRPDHTIERITLRFDDERPGTAGDANAASDSIVLTLRFSPH